MVIENVERFHCPSCGFITYDKECIEMIRKLGGKCPVCSNGHSTKWEKHQKPHFQENNTSGYSSDGRT